MNIDTPVPATPLRVGEPVSKWELFALEFSPDASRRETCRLCGKELKPSRVGIASHVRKHLRDGDLRELSAPERFRASMSLQERRLDYVILRIPAFVDRATGGAR